jgi:hypothetical protein
MFLERGFEVDHSTINRLLSILFGADFNWLTSRER